MEQKFINLKTEMDNYIEKFKLEFDLAQTDDVKEELLVNLLDNADIKQHKELLSGPKYKRFLIDIQNKTRILCDTKVNSVIKAGSYESYTCIKSVDEYIEGLEYYVNIKENSSEMTEVFNDFRDVSISDDSFVWIVTERNSLKYEKMVVDFKFFEEVKVI
jgi:hypothetical protein